MYVLKYIRMHIHGVYTMYIYYVVVHISTLRTNYVHGLFHLVV